MFKILIMRGEVVSLIVLMLLVYTAHNLKFKTEGRSLFRMGQFAALHSLFDIVAVMLTTNPDVIPHWLDKGCHIALFTCSVFFCYELARHMAVMCHMPTWEYNIRRYGKILPIMFIFVSPFLPIEHRPTMGTITCSGIFADVAYDINMLYLLLGVAIMVISYVRIIRKSQGTRNKLEIVLLCFVIFEVFQIIFRETLFTDAMYTSILACCFFISLENPWEAMEQKLQKDALTGLGSRHSYEAMISSVETRLEKDPSTSFAVVFCDLNNLKHVNDVYGHATGDQYIGIVAGIMTDTMTTADEIYRIGGDEFVAVYINKNEKRILWEIDCLHEKCRDKSKNHPYVIAIATGFAASNEECSRAVDVLEIADFRMCEDKAKQKKQKYDEEVEERGSINVSGLTDRIFDAFDNSGSSSYIFLRNLETGVTRISRRFIRDFGLSGEYILDFQSEWVNRIHPDDRQRYLESINKVHVGKAKSYEIEYRVMNLQGKYVFCSCKAGVLKGKDGDPDLFCGTVTNHSLFASIDALTGLPNKMAYSQRVADLIEDHEQAAVLKLSLTTFSRINLLYGYDLGNEVIRIFADKIRTIVGERGEIYRLDGTKFALILPGASREEVNEIYDKIQFVAQHKIIANFMHISLRIAGGVYMKPAEFIGTEDTVRSNMMFAYENSKYDSYGSLKYYSEVIRGNNEYHLLSAIHRDANDKMDGFYMRYQPIVDSDTEMIVGAEALMRWKNPEYGEVDPGRFIEWLENDPCYFDLANHVMRRVIADAAEMRKYYPNFSININITIQQLQHEGFHAEIEKILAETGYPPKLINLEMTERCRALDELYLCNEIEYFHSLGLRIAMDDVGTGSSAFALILHLPVDEVKMDRAFVNQIQSKAANQAFVHSVIEISKEKNYYICFEGIKDAATRDYLKRYSGTLFQGYYYAKPLLIQELRELMKKQRRLNASPFLDNQ